VTDTVMLVKTTRPRAESAKPLLGEQFADRAEDAGAGRFAVTCSGPLRRPWLCRSHNSLREI
jgi:hypothetical protein